MRTAKVHALTVKLKVDALTARVHPSIPRRPNTGSAPLLSRSLRDTGHWSRTGAATMNGASIVNDSLAPTVIVFGFETSISSVQGPGGHEGDNIGC